MFEAALCGLAWIFEEPTDLPRPRTHSGLIAGFGQHLVQTGRLPAEFGRSLNRVQDLRLTADYFPRPVSPDKAKWAIEEAERFLSAILQLLGRPPLPVPDDPPEKRS
jgi:hypothetical protein